MGYRFTRPCWGFALAAIFVSLASCTISKSVGTAKDASLSQQEVYKKVYNGWKYFHVYCSRCHGQDMFPTPMAPDLRTSLRAPDKTKFFNVIMNGSQSTINPNWIMPAWKGLIDKALATDIFYYINARLENILPPGRPDEVGPKGGPWEPPLGWNPLK